VAMPRRIIAPHRVASDQGAVGALRAKTAKGLVRQAIGLGFNVPSVKVTLRSERPVGMEPAPFDEASHPVIPLLWRPASQGQNGCLIAVTRAAMRICACTPSTSAAARARLWLSPRCSRNNVLACHTMRCGSCGQGRAVWAA